ncbi:MAG: hypothetical protein KJO42_01970 [Silicimonas sp.]|nr:hypothetical protein [Silicimonas sp.]
MTANADSPTWQCLLICWGDKYHSEYINHTIRAVIRECATTPRFVLISDRPRPGLHPDVTVVEFDPWWLQKQFRTISLQAKLYMFEKGVVPDDLPCVYLDLDTAVLGDIGQAVGLMKNRKSLLMVQSVVLPFGWPGRLVYRLTGGRRYARGNSSIVVFHPAECSYIPETFRALYERYDGTFGIRPMIGDERFISWCAQMHINRIPNWLGVKFLNEYMHSAKWMIYLKGALPWVRARREGVAAVTLPGEFVKPELLVTYEDGYEIRDEKNRWLLWNDRALGAMRGRLQDYYRPLFKTLDKIDADKSG